MSNADNIFWQRFGLILGLLIIFGFIVAFIARDIAGDAFESTISRPEAVAKRIAPAGSVRVGDPTQVVAAAPTAVAAAAAPASAPAGDAPADGEAVYNGACVACHVAGVAGAPKLGDQTAWAPRVALGEDALVMSVINGKGAMPAKGGNPALSEEQIRAAVQFMLGKPGSMGAMSQTEEKVEQVVAAATQATEKATAAMTDAADAAKDMSARAADTAGSAGAAAMTATAPTTGDGETAGKPGEQVYNMGCVACHATGVANAPKLDDKAAWETRVGTIGVAALVSSVLNGKGAMPAKGGIASLTETDLSNAVRYMLEQAGVDAGG